MQYNQERIKTKTSPIRRPSQLYREIGKHTALLFDIMCTYPVFDCRLTKNRQTTSHGSEGHNSMSAFKGAVNALCEQESLVPISRSLSSPSELQYIAYAAPEVIQTQTALSRVF